jgi:hypothetical protein
MTYEGFKQMTKNQTSKLTALAFAASLVLTACGGDVGGNGTVSTTGASTTAPASAPATDPNINATPQTSVAAPNYGLASAQYAMYVALNAYRSNMGVGMVSQDVNLDHAAQAHTNYVQINVNSGAESGLTHTENAANPGFYEATPYQRSVKAGSSINLWVGEDVDANYSATGVQAMDGATCMQTWIDTVYHLQGATSNQTSVGLGYAARVSMTKLLYYCVADFAVMSRPAPASSANYNSIAYDGGQQIPVGTVVHAPFSGETGVALAMHVETPNPAPDVATPGRPIMVRINEQLGDTLTVDSFQLTDASGAVVVARIIVSPASLSGSVAGAAADVNNELESGVAFLLPLQPLAPNTVYTVAFKGKRDAGTAKNATLAVTWQFTTAAN